MVKNFESVFDAFTLIPWTILTPRVYCQNQQLYNIMTKYNLIIFITTICCARACFARVDEEAGPLLGFERHEKTTMKKEKERIYNIL